MELFNKPPKRKKIKTKGDFNRTTKQKDKHQKTKTNPNVWNAFKKCFNLADGGSCESGTENPITFNAGFRSLPPDVQDKIDPQGKADEAPTTYKQEPGKAPMLRNCGSSRYNK